METPVWIWPTIRGKKKERYRQTSKFERIKHLHLNLPNNERHTALEKRKDVGPDRTLKEKCLDDIMILNVNRSSKSRYSSKISCWMFSFLSLMGNPYKQTEMSNESNEWLSGQFIFFLSEIWFCCNLVSETGSDANTFWILQEIDRSVLQIL